jgi:adenylyltransferase/sulfurtransferase
MSSPSSILVVGAGGLGAPVLRLLAAHEAVEITLIDDDVVEESNLHRQTLYGMDDVGRPKTESAVRSLTTLSPDCTIRAIEGRFVPANAVDHLRGHDLVVEGADNLATKFLVADAARLAGVSAVQAGAVRWNGWALCSTPESACLRCLFEDIPRDRIETCAEAGVVGPMVGVLGGLQASFAFRLLSGEHPGGELWHYDALHGALRKTFVRRRGGCPLCEGKIKDLRVERYTAACAA